MCPVGYDYDTAAIRREARKVQRCCERLEEAALPRVQQAREKLDGEFMGRTADELDNSLEKARNKINALRNELMRLYRTLDRFADELEETDRRLADLFDQ